MCSLICALVHEQKHWVTFNEWAVLILISRINIAPTLCFSVKYDISESGRFWLFLLITAELKHFFTLSYNMAHLT